MTPLIFPAALVVGMLLGIGGVVVLGGGGVVLLFRALSGRTKGSGRRASGVLGGVAMLVAAFGCCLPLAWALVNWFLGIWRR